MDRELLIEIGCEELPASWLPPLTRQLGELVSAQLAEARLVHPASPECFSTPRRLTVRVTELAGRERDAAAAVAAAQVQLRQAKGKAAAVAAAVQHESPPLH